MKYQLIGQVAETDPPCRYGLSRLWFRGPPKSLDGTYVACIGGSETYGRFIEEPFSDMLEFTFNQTFVNLGCVNAGPEAFVKEPAVRAAAHDAEAVIVQIMGAQNLTNPYYSVHPRRNDRFLKASEALEELFPEVDFSQVTFTRGLLKTLLLTSKTRFEVVRSALQDAWLTQMKDLLSEIPGPVILTWFADHPPTRDGWLACDHPLQAEPLFVSRPMLDELAPLVTHIEVCVPSDEALLTRKAGLVFGAAQSAAASEALGLAAHAELAGRLLPVLWPLLR